MLENGGQHMSAIPFDCLNNYTLKLHQPFNPLTTKLFNLNFHSLEVVSR